MAFMFNAARPQAGMSVSSRARTEAFAGLLLLVIALTVLTYYSRGGGFSNMLITSSNLPKRPILKDMHISGKIAQDTITYGNGLKDGQDTHGWFMGHFIKDTTSLRHSKTIESKWIMHKAGKQHDGFVTNRQATSMAILIAGKHRVEFENGSVMLEYPGDYVIWATGVAHSWTAIVDSTILCVRWPSLPDDQVYQSTQGAVRNQKQHVHPATGVSGTVGLGYNPGGQYDDGRAHAGSGHDGHSQRAHNTSEFMIINGRQVVRSTSHPISSHDDNNSTAATLTKISKHSTAADLTKNMPPAGAEGAGVQ